MVFIYVLTWITSPTTLTITLHSLSKIDQIGGTEDICVTLYMTKSDKRLLPMAFASLKNAAQKKQNPMNSLYAGFVADPVTHTTQRRDANPPFYAPYTHLRYIPRGLESHAYQFHPSTHHMSTRYRWQYFPPSTREKKSQRWLGKIPTLCYAPFAPPKGLQN